MQLKKHTFTNFPVYKWKCFQRVMQPRCSLSVLQGERWESSSYLFPRSNWIPSIFSQHHHVPVGHSLACERRRISGSSSPALFSESFTPQTPQLSRKPQELAHINHLTVIFDCDSESIFIELQLEKEMPPVRQVSQLTSWSWHFSFPSLGEGTAQWLRVILQLNTRAAKSRILSFLLLISDKRCLQSLSCSIQMLSWKWHFVFSVRVSPV